MTQYAAIAPTFWNGETGKKIRQKGVEAQVVALYLVTSPHRNALGLYYLPKILIAHETGLPFKGASKALRSLIEAGFCTYDEASEVVFVYEMAKYQIGKQLKPGDNRVKWINEKYSELPKNPFLGDFFDKYGEAFHIEKRRNGKPLESPSEAPSKPDTDTDSDTDTDTDSDVGAELQDTSAQPDPPQEDPVLKMPLITKEEYPIFQSDIDDWQDAYPAVDVLQELKNIRQWNLSNPKKQKTKSGIRKHITNWLAKEQDRGGKGRHPPGQKGSSTLSPRQQHNASVLGKVREDMYGRT